MDYEAMLVAILHHCDSTYEWVHDQHITLGDGVGLNLVALTTIAYYGDLNGRQLKAIFDKQPGPDPYPWPEE